jgi:hypothetical protein
MDILIDLKTLRVNVLTHPTSMLCKHRGNIVLSWVNQLAHYWQAGRVNKTIHIHVHLEDGVDADHQTVCGKAIECWAFCCHKDAKHIRLVPDANYLNELGYRRLRRKMVMGDVPWHKKRKLVFWRGASTGGHLETTTSIAKNTRVKACLILPQKLPQGSDIRLSHISQTSDPEVMKMLTPLLGGRSSIQEQLNYRYLLDIDGNTNAWSGLFWRMLSNSVVIKIRSPYRQWYYQYLTDQVVWVECVEDVPYAVNRLLSSSNSSQINMCKRATKLCNDLSYARETQRFANIFAKQWGIPMKQQVVRCRSSRYRSKPSSAA